MRKVNVQQKRALMVLYTTMEIFDGRIQLPFDALRGSKGGRVLLPF